jgi:hypothetical protein
MTPALTRGLEGQSLPAFGMQPSGMLRIRLGQQERYIWPVHLPGWLAAGWRVAGSDAVAATEPMFADPVDVAVPGAFTSLSSAANPTPPPELPEPAASAGATPAPTRGRRGRRRKEEASTSDTERADVLSQDSTPPEQSLENSEPTGDGTDHVLGESGSDVTAESASDSSAASSADAALAVDPDPAPETDSEPVLTALPDDLFDDPLT